MSEPTAYPLNWPMARPRTPHRTTHGKFKQSFSQARDNCIAEIKRLGGINPIISTNINVKRDGIPYAVKWGQLLPDPGVAVYFKRNGKDLCFACDRWNHVQDNMVAVAKTIEALRGIARWGTGDMMEAAFTGFKALPEATGSSWWSVLGVSINAAEEQVKDSYRMLVKKHHPDAGGDAELFRRVQEAYQEFERQVVK